MVMYYRKLKAQKIKSIQRTVLQLFQPRTSRKLIQNRIETMQRQKRDTLRLALYKTDWGTLLSLQVMYNGNLNIQDISYNNITSRKYMQVNKLAR